MRTIDGKSILEEMKTHGMYTGGNSVFISIQDSKFILENAMKFFLSLDGKELIWKPEYDEISEWLSDNKGKGLLMFGNSGLGKSVLGMKVIPAILLKYSRKIVKTYGVNEMNQRPEEVLKCKLISIDDIGTEDVLNSYGNRRMVFADVIDEAEKNGNLVILSTNLDKDKLIDKYGFRVYDRIIATTKRIEFSGKSLRF